VVPGACFSNAALSNGQFWELADAPDVVQLAPPALALSPVAGAAARTCGRLGNAGLGRAAATVRAAREDARRVNDQRQRGNARQDRQILTHELPPLMVQVCFRIDTLQPLSGAAKSARTVASDGLRLLMVRACFDSAASLDSPAGFTRAGTPPVRSVET
jgi:hypothetical protein